MASTPLRIIQISDTHLFGDAERDLLGVKTRESFGAVLALLEQEQRPDFIILSGDISQDDSKDSYLYIAEQLKKLAVPVYYIPGNHDAPEMLQQVFPRDPLCADKQIVTEHWQIILLDSQKPGSVEGYVDQFQLDFLQKALQQYPEHHAMIVFHHHPVMMQSAWLDKLGLKNAAELWEILEKNPQSKIVLFGHVHQQHEGERNGIRYLSAPSTCIQFKVHSDRFALEKLPPGYRWLELYADGTCQTVVRRVAEYVGVFDRNAKGY